MLAAGPSTVRFAKCASALRKRETMSFTESPLRRQQALRLDGGDDLQALGLWVEWHRRLAHEVKMLPREEVMCSCINPVPAAGYEPHEELCARGTLQWQLFGVRNRAVVTLLSLLMFMYLPIASKVLAFFRCQQIGDEWLMVAQRDTRCFSAVWWQFAPLACMGVLGWVVAIPVGSIWMLNRARTAHVAPYTRLLSSAGGTGQSTAGGVGCCRRQPYTKQQVQMHEWQISRAQGATKQRQASGLAVAAPQVVCVHARKRYCATL